MKTAIVFVVLGVYVVLALGIARLCAVNAGWERASNLFPRRGSDNGMVKPEPKEIGTHADVSSQSGGNTQEV